MDNNPVVPPSDLNTRKFTHEYNAIQRLFAADELEECIARARELITKPANPLYHLIRELLILVDAVEDFGTAWEFQKEAAVLWHLLHYCNSEQQDKYPENERVLEVCGMASRI
jgi:hypothetical protein